MTRHTYFDFATLITTGLSGELSSSCLLLAVSLPPQRRDARTSAALELNLICSTGVPGTVRAVSQ